MIRRDILVLYTAVSDQIVKSTMLTDDVINP